MARYGIGVSIAMVAWAVSACGYLGHPATGEESEATSEAFSGGRPKVASLDPTSGPSTGGTNVKAQGSNFARGLKITVGGIAATGVMRVSRSIVQFTTPPHVAGAAAVVVTNPDGTSSGGTVSFTYVDADVASGTTSGTGTGTPPPPPPPPSTTTTGGGVGAAGSTFVESGPITLRSGQTVTGLHISNPNGPCISGSNVTNVRITNNVIGPCASDDSGIGVSLEGSSSVQIDHNSFDDVASALYALTSTDAIVFDHNQATRIRGPQPRGQLVQFDKTVGSGNRIVCNVSDQTTPGYQAGPEDHVNMYASGGTSSSPIEIAYNKVRGGGPSDSGGGLLAGDNDSQYVTVHDNILINPGQYGLAISGGHYFRYLSNRVYSPKPFAWSNVGLYVWAQGGVACGGHEVRGNRVFYVNSSGQQNAFWNGNNCGDVLGLTDNVWGDTTLSDSMWDETIAQCQ